MGDAQKITGRIYMIKAPGHEGCYIGSTTKTLEQRLYQHKKDYARYVKGKYHHVRSFEILKREGATIHLLHEGQFDSKTDLLKLEGSYIVDMGDSVVNKNIAGATRAESNSKWYKAHKEAHCKTVADYYAKNQNFFLEKHTCDVCGGTYTIKHKAQHCKTKKHQQALPVLREALKSQVA